jgi:hypothetical protein
MLLIRKHHQADADPEADDAPSGVAPDLAQPEPPVAQPTPTLGETVRDLHTAGHSQRSVARDFNLTRRKVKQIIDHALLSYLCLITNILSHYSLKKDVTLPNLKFLPHSRTFGYYKATKDTATWQEHGNRL